MTASIIVIEDEPAICELLTMTLEAQGNQVKTFNTAEAGLAAINDELPDLILLDWMLPKLSGIEFAKYLRANERTKNVPVIMLTAKSEERDKLEGLEVGADDYIVKPFSPRELNARIKALLRRVAPQATQDHVKFLEMILDPVSYTVNIQQNTVDLGPTEFRLLHFFLTHLNRVYSRVQLLDFVWGDHVFIEERTVDVHIRRLRAALEPYKYEKYLHTVRGAGYRFSES